MKPKHTLLDSNSEILPRIPSWIRVKRVETIENVAFLSGAALSNLHIVLQRDDVPQALLRARLALFSAEACIVFSGRSERAGDLRDEVHLQGAGDEPGPAGKIYRSWQRAIERPVSIKTLHRALPPYDPTQIAVWLDPPGLHGAGWGNAVDRAACVFEAVSTDVAHAEELALILADAALAQAMGWDHLVPLLATNLTSRDLRKSGEELRLACYRALVNSARHAGHMAHDLARKSAQLRAIAPKLRAKGAARAVEMFLTQDALAPSGALREIMSDRAARRICDRVVELGVVRELTGRDSFRLYGV